MPIIKSLKPNLYAIPKAPLIKNSDPKYIKENPNTKSNNDFNPFFISLVLDCISVEKYFINTIWGRKHYINQIKLIHKCIQEISDDNFLNIKYSIYENVYDFGWEI